MLTDTSLGLPGSMSDSNCFVETSIPYLRTAGITSVKFPGNRDVADLYHWSTGKTTPYKGGDPGYIAFDWSLQPLLPPDWKTLDEASLLQNQGYNQRNVIDLLLEPILQDDKRYCPAGHLPRLAFASAAIANWVEVKHPVAEALWADDFYALLIESGSANINWSAMYGDSMLSANGGKPGPVFYGLQMLHIMAYRPGDLLVDARSNSLLLAAHATRRRDGIVGLMLIQQGSAQLRRSEDNAAERFGGLNRPTHRLRQCAVCREIRPDRLDILRSRQDIHRDDSSLHDHGHSVAGTKGEATDS